jgi:hypothetical protein
MLLQGLAASLRSIAPSWQTSQGNYAAFMTTLREYLVGSQAPCERSIPMLRKKRSSFDPDQAIPPDQMRDYVDK